MVIQFNFCFLSFISITASDKDTGEKYESQDGDKNLTLVGKYWVNIPLQGVVKYYKFVFVQLGEAEPTNTNQAGKGSEFSCRLE